MANRYWVGGTGNWSSTARWSTTSGGAGGASVPGTADAAIFDGSSGGGTATVDSSVTIQTLTMTAYTGTLAFGTNTISLNSTGTIYTGDVSYNVSGTPVINCTSSGATAITVSCAATTEANSISFNFSAGTYSLTLTGNSRNLNFTGFSGTLNNVARTIYGNLTISTGMTLTAGGSTQTFAATSGTKTITTNGKTLDFPITFDGVGGTWQLQDACTVGSTRTITLNNGTLDINGKTLTSGLFSSGNSNIRTIAFGTGNITVVSTGTVFLTNPLTNLSVSGTPVVNINNNTATATTVSPGLPTEANSISFNFTSGTYSLQLGVNPIGVRNLDFTGFSGTLINTARTIYGNLTISTGMTLSAGTSIQTFAATSGTKTITTNGKTLDFPLTFNGAGGTWQLQDALTMGSTTTLTHNNGTVDLNGKTLTVGTGYLTAAGTKNLTFNGGSLVCPAANTTSFNNAVPTGYTTTAGTGTGKISMTAATAKTFVGGGSTFNCTLSNDGAGALTVTGSNTFTNIANGVQPTTFTFTAGTTQTVSNFSVSGTAGNLVTINSTAVGSRATLSDASGIISVSYVSIQDSAATGGATWRAFTSNGNVNAGNNAGWNFAGGAFLMMM